MPRLIPFALCLLFIPSLAIAQGNLFKKEITFGNNQRTQLNDMCLTSDGHVLALTMSNQQLVLMKMKLNGDTAWTRWYDTKRSIITYAVEEHTNGTYVTAGVWSNGTTNSDNGFLARHDSVGNIMWTVTSSASGYTRWWDVATGADSSIVTIGYRDAGDDYGLISKFDASGKLLWSKEAVLSKGVDFDKVAIDASGNIVVAGHHANGGSIVIKFNSAGTVLWNKVSAANIYGCKGLEILPSGNIIISGKVRPTRFNNVFLHKFSPNGTLLLAKEYWSNSFCEPYDVQLAFDDKLMIYGETIAPFGGGFNYQNMLMQVDTAGKLNWSYCYGDTTVTEARACGLFTPDSANWIGSYTDQPNRNFLFKIDKKGSSSCLRYPLVFTDSTHKVTYSSGPLIRNYSLTTSSVTWTKGKHEYKDTLICSKNLCKLTAKAKVLSNFNGFGVGCFGDNNGAASVTVQNGAMPIKYEWSANAQNQTTDTANGLAAGKYYVTVTDAQTCSVIDSVVITQPDSLTDSLRVLTDFNGWNISCAGANDGKVVLTTKGGVAPQQYFWNGDTLPGGSDTAVNLAGGWNSVIIQDANECKITDSIFLTEPTPLTVSISSSTKSGCSRNDAIAVANASGGAGGYGYQWDANAGFQTTDTAKTLSAGKYWVVATDANGCLDSTSVDILDHDQPKVQMGLVKNPKCFGDCNGEATVLTISGKSPFAYQWGASAQNQTTQKASSLCDGEYWVVVTDSNNCKDSALATIVEPVALDTTVLEGANGLTSNALGVDYQWLDCDNGNAPVAGAISQTYMPVSSGSYSVVVSNDSCSDTSKCYYVISVNSSARNSAVSSVEVWPNPNDGSFSVKMNEHAGTSWNIRLVDAMGRTHFHGQLGANGVQEINPTSIPKGIYSLQLENGKERRVKTIVVR